MLVPRHLAILLASTLLVLTAVSACPAAPVVQLTRWEEPASLVRHHAPGVEYYRLIARATWTAGAEAGKAYNMHVIYPDGRTETRPIPRSELRTRRLTALVRTAEVRNRRPADVVLWFNVSDPATNEVVSNELVATIEDFPRPRPTNAPDDPGPFGWGEPLSGPAGEPRVLPRLSPGGFEFVRIPAADGQPGFFIATSEATNAQLAKDLPGYDPRAGRSDEFNLEDPLQPALGLSPKQAHDYLAALGKTDPSGVTYRLPAQTEWLRAARAGKTTAFWWGDEPSYPGGANFLGPEPARPNDATAPARSVHGDGVTGFEANPWGLFHTFGNVAEWATAAGAGFVRMGGHFRTEPAAPLPDVAVEDPATTGPDPYVGIRPAFDLDADTGADLVHKALKGNALLAGVAAAYDPDRATATLTGTLPDPALRRAAERRLESLWFLAAVEDRVETPKKAASQLATLGPIAGKVRRITPLGRWIYVVPISVAWSDPLPVEGSEWFVNVYPHGDSSGQGHYAYKLAEVAPDASGRLDVLVDRGKLIAAGVAPGASVAVALSLGAAAPTPADPRVVSNVATLHWSAP